jgi:hypothetical protein
VGGSVEGWEHMAASPVGASTPITCSREAATAWTVAMVAAKSIRAMSTVTEAMTTVLSPGAGGATMAKTQVGVYLGLIWSMGPNLGQKGAARLDPSS